MAKSRDQSNKGQSGSRKSPAKGGGNRNAKQGGRNNNRNNSNSRSPARNNNSNNNRNNNNNNRNNKKPAAKKPVEKKDKTPEEVRITVSLCGTATTLGNAVYFRCDRKFMLHH
ncbi:hypothetical protein TrLO_g3519 [Triparma laevis f. longispina]|uniref:Uncharacterized protein n=1 Tax=Triparma laevis f. longispina TaxID=1714387 RepID=A0A9W7CD89_9STRA|nr:hypothetical protein TrLO_g3519 [Triparma laevis f. longispina]